MSEQTEPVWPCSTTLFLRSFLRYENQELQIRSVWIWQSQHRSQDKRASCEGYQNWLKIQTEEMFKEPDNNRIGNCLSARFSYHGVTAATSPMLSTHRDSISLMWNHLKLLAQAFSECSTSNSRSPPACMDIGRTVFSVTRSFPKSLLLKLPHISARLPISAEEMKISKRQISTLPYISKTGFPNMQLLCM